MRKRLLLLATAAMLLAFNLVNVRAQTKPSNDKNTPRFEIGGHLYSMATTGSVVTDSGAGGRFTYNLNRYLAIDTELNAPGNQKQSANRRRLRGQILNRLVAMLVVS